MRPAVVASPSKKEKKWYEVQGHLRQCAHCNFDDKMGPVRTTGSVNEGRKRTLFLR
jgi:hypothetical protein